MSALGTHLLVELRDCNRQYLDDLPLIRKALITAAERVGATILGDTFHRFSPQGVTGIVAIAESHLSIHTWPEFGYAAVDIFTCGTGFNPRDAASMIIDRLESADSEVIELHRGRLPVSTEAGTHT